MHFSFFDVFFFSVFLVSSFLGFYRGLFVTVLHIVKFLCVIVFTIFLMPLAQDITTEYTSYEMVANTIALVLSYVLSSILFGFTAIQIEALTSPFIQGLVDKALGGFVGMVRGVAIGIASFMCITVASSGSYIEAKNAMEALTDTNQKRYPNWLTKSSSFDFLQTSSSKVITIIKDTPLETWLTETKLHEPQPQQDDKSMEDKATETTKKIKDKLSLQNLGG